MDATDSSECVTPFDVTILAFTISHGNAQFPGRPSRELASCSSDHQAIEG